MIVDEEDENNVPFVYSPTDMLRHGLLFSGLTEKQINRSSLKRNIQRFTDHYGANHIVCAQIWEELQTTTIIEARVHPDHLCLKYFLMSMHALRNYPTESQREKEWNISPKTGRQWVWFYLEKIQALKAQKITWPVDNYGTDVWILTVDGIHSWYHETKKGEFSQDSEYYSHKYGKAGVGYELGIALSEPRLIWMHGPFKAGFGDRKTFQINNVGLRAKLRSLGKKCIADSAYYSKENRDVVSALNPHDYKVVKKFKTRALQRHEKFNGMLKVFGCLDGRFRHTLPKYKIMFEACAVICQYKMENGQALYDILVERMVE